MSTVEALATAIVADPLEGARAFARPGGRAIGYVGQHIPIELILSAGAMPVRLTGIPAGQTLQADRYVEVAFTPESRSIMEQWLKGSFDFLDAVIFSRSDDSAQRLYYYLCELQRRQLCGGPRPVIYDVARIPRASSEAHTIAATTTLATEIGCGAENLKKASIRVEERMAVLSRLRAARLTPHPPAGSIAHQLVRAADQDWTQRFDVALAAWLSAPPAIQASRRILLAGSEPPDERLHLAVESGGATIVAEFSSASCMEPQNPKAGLPDSIAALGRRSHKSLSLAQTFMTSPTILAEYAHVRRADGVILWLISEDEALVWELPAQLRALARAGIPVLALTRQNWASPPDVLAMVTQFVAQLRAQP